MVRYIKCPRCELNYIDEEKQEYCDVCIAELKGNKLKFADLNDDEYEELDGELEQTEICPVCGVNRMRYGDKMCDACRKESEYEEDDIDIEKDEEWKNYLDDEEEGDLTIDDETLQEELDAEFADEEEEEEETDEDEFFDEDPLDDFDDDFDDIDDDDDLDDDEEDEDDEDF